MWKIVPLDLGVLTTKKSGLIFGGKPESVEIPCIGWILTNEKTGRKIVIDAGPCDDEEWGTRYHNPLKKHKNQRLEIALSKHGVVPDEVDLCILTHLHWDHAYGVLKLPKVKTLVQKEELRYAVDPFPPDWKHYERNIEGRNPFFLEFYSQIETVVGDCEIEKGIKLFHLPGHSPGSQGVLVTTAQGEFLIVGDLINVIESWESNPKLPPGIYGSLQDCYTSFAKIKKLNATILPGHDWRVFKMFS